MLDFIFFKKRLETFMLDLLNSQCGIFCFSFQLSLLIIIMIFFSYLYSDESNAYSDCHCFSI